MWVWVKLDIYIYHEGCLSVRNAVRLCNSGDHETVHGTSVGPGYVDNGLARQRGQVGEDLGEISPKL